MISIVFYIVSVSFAIISCLLYSLSFRLFYFLNLNLKTLCEIDFKHHQNAKHSDFIHFLVLKSNVVKTVVRTSVKVLFLSKTTLKGVYCLYIMFGPFQYEL